MNKDFGSKYSLYEYNFIDVIFGLLPNGDIRGTFLNEDNGFTITADLNKIIYYERRLYVDRFRMYNITKLSDILNYITDGVNYEIVIEMIAYVISGVMYRIHSSPFLKDIIMKYGDIRMVFKIPKANAKCLLTYKDFSDNIFLSSPIGFDMSVEQQDFLIQFLFRRNKNLEAEALVLNPRTGIFTTTDVYLYNGDCSDNDRKDSACSRTITAKLGTLSFYDEEFKNNKLSDKIRNNLKYKLSDIYFYYSKNILNSDKSYYIYEFFYNPVKNTYVNGNFYNLGVGEVKECDYEYAKKAKRVHSYFR